MGSEKRDSYMDFLKGIAIIAVVVGHSISNVSKVDFLFQAIYSFHMPMLIFISAYIEEECREKYRGKEKSMLIRRMGGLLLPYLSWTVIYAAVFGQMADMGAAGFGRMLTGYEQNGLWFFPVLFGLKVMHFLYWTVGKRIAKHTLLTDMMLCFALEAVVAVLAVLTRQPYLINMLSYAIPYFLAVLLVEHESLRKLSGRECTCAGAVFIYGLMFPFFSFHDPHWTTQVIRIGMSLCVIVICLKFQEKWRENAVSKIVCVYGQYSLGIYVLHVFFMDYKIYFSRIESTVTVSFLAVVAACVVVVVCILIVKLIRISLWWRLILLGEKERFGMKGIRK